MAPGIVSRLLSYFTFALNFQARQAGHSPDGREQALLQYVEKNAERDNPESVINAIDEFTNENWMTTLGKDKGAILDAVVKRVDPRIALELGTYCGYSTIKIASKMTRTDCKLLSIEINPDNYAIAKDLIAFSGLSSKVELMLGTLSDVCEEAEEFLANEEGQYFDLIFMDHFKDCYLLDFQLLKDRRMIGTGSTILANCKSYPVSYDYLNYLKEHLEEMDTEDVDNGNVTFITWLPCTLTLSTYKADLSGHTSTLVI